MSKPLTLDRLLYTARRFGASDIHLIAGLPPAWRVNGEIVLAEAEPYSAETLARLALDALTEAQRETFEKEMALSYSLTHSELGRFRVSVYLRNGSPALSIRACAEKLRTREELGLPEAVDRLLDRPSGLILVTGPTGSGKTTTLNYMIDQINSRRCGKIIMIEDPIEYVHTHKMSLVVQQELHSDVRSFHEGLLHILRQDPDVILVGEIRDRETADIAINAALTGHLVLSTLHTNDAVGAITRLSDMGVEGFLVASALFGVLSQRLVRQVCPNCRGAGSGPAGRCRNCSGSGYRGRTGIYELLRIDDELRGAIVAKRPSGEINEIARRNGMIPLLEDGRSKVNRGITTEAELLRIAAGV